MNIREQIDYEIDHGCLQSERNYSDPVAMRKELDNVNEETKICVWATADKGQKPEWCRVNGCAFCDRFIARPRGGK